jgi:homocitrate synthase NifV
MNRSRPDVTLKDSTLREGLDTPGVSFDTAARLQIATLLAEAGVPEIELVAPSRVLTDLVFARAVKEAHLFTKTSGLVYANRAHWRSEVESCAGSLDRVDLLIPLSERRSPPHEHEKLALLEEVMAGCRTSPLEIGVGFPHATQVDMDFLLQMSVMASEAGAARVTIYDTNGSAEPFGVHTLVTRLREKMSTPLLFHAHNDLGLATANSWAAVRAGAAGLDVTINGLGDRAGNASLEQTAMLLHLEARNTGVNLARLRHASVSVEKLSGVKISKLSPVVGEYVFAHKSPSHLFAPSEFEAFRPELVGRSRSMEPSDEEPGSGDLG